MTATLPAGGFARRGRVSLPPLTSAMLRDGGSGCNAGDLSLSGGILAPMPTSFVDRYTIRAFLSGEPFTTDDDSCSTGSTVIGHVIEARSAANLPLYRLRLSPSRAELLGGFGWHSKRSFCGRLSRRCGAGWRGCPDLGEPSAVSGSENSRLRLVCCLTAALILAACQPKAEAGAAERVAVDTQLIAAPDPGIHETPIVQIRLDGRQANLLPGTSLVVVGGGLINNRFPERSADGSQIALLYDAGDPMLVGYPRFEIHSTATLELMEGVDLVPPTVVQQGADLHDQQVVMRIEGLLDAINLRLREGEFRSMRTLFDLPAGASMDHYMAFGKRIAFPGDDSAASMLTIRSAATNQIELKLEMPQGMETLMTEPEELLCGWGGLPRRAWYDAELHIAVIHVEFSTSTHGCEQPEQWLLERLVP